MLWYTNNISHTKFNKNFILSYFFKNYLKIFDKTFKIITTTLYINKNKFLLKKIYKFNNIYFLLFSKSILLNQFKKMLFFFKKFLFKNNIYIINNSYDLDIYILNFLISKKIKFKQNLFFSEYLTKNLRHYKILKNFKKFLKISKIKIILFLFVKKSIFFFKVLEKLNILLLGLFPYYFNLKIIQNFMNPIVVSLHYDFYITLITFFLYDLVLFSIKKKKISFLKKKL